MARSLRLLRQLAISFSEANAGVAFERHLHGISRGVETACADKAPTTRRLQLLSWSALGAGFAAAGLAASSLVHNAEAEPVAVLERPSRLGKATGPPSEIPTKQTVVFVLGGPGSGKGTQCAKLVEEFDMAHFSAGDLLRAHVKSGTPDGNMVAEMIQNGQIVPSEVTVNLLRKAMEESGKNKVLIDGFPRNLENRGAFERVMGFDCAMVLFFDCPEEVLERRLLSRNQGRVDDNIETIKKRFKVFLEQSMPVIVYYDKLGKVKHIDTDRPVDVIYAEVRSFFV